MTDIPVPEPDAPAGDQDDAMIKPIERSPDPKRMRERHIRLKGWRGWLYGRMVVPAEVPEDFNEPLQQLVEKLSTNDSLTAATVLEEAQAIFEETSNRVESTERRATTLQGTVSIAAFLLVAGAGLLLDPSRITDRSWRIALIALLATVLASLIACAWRALAVTGRMFEHEQPGPERIFVRAKMPGLAAQAFRAAELLRASAVANEIAAVKVGLLRASASWLRLALVMLAFFLAALVIYVATSQSAPARQLAASRCPAHFPAVIKDGFPEPPMLASSAGRLNVMLRMAEGPVKIDHHTYLTETYDGTFPGPTLLMCPGDDVTVRLVNDMAQPTNLHVHGLHVSPQDNHDNVFLEIWPHERFTYRYRLPLDHDTGAFWYHPHLHHLVAPQIFAGLSGAIIVEGGLDTLLPNVPQRLMVIQSTELCTPAGRSVGFPGSGTEPCSYPGRVMPVQATNERYTPLFLNGAIDPTVKIRPGQIQRWRIFNANDNRIVVLNLRGQDLQVLAQDGNTLRWMRPTRDLMIGPGSRREVLVRGGPPGRYEMKALKFEQFPGGDQVDPTSRDGGPTPNQTVLTLVSGGAPAHERLPSGPFGSPADLRRGHIDRRREIVFSERKTGMNMFEFLINRRTFDRNHVEVTMKLNSIEQWTLINETKEWHTFHIHVNPFQVVSIKGRAVDFVDYQDNVAMPPKSRVVILLHPTDFTGKFVFHCHVTNHEDRGMMAAVEVSRNPTSAQLSASVAMSGGFSIRSGAYGATGVLPALLAFICRAREVGTPAASSTRLPAYS